MRKGGGKQKGGAFERLVCDQLSRWIDPAGEDDHFWRSAMSGGRHTVRKQKGHKGKSQAGDVSAITLQGAVLVNEFVIECKHLKSLKLTNALITGTGMLSEIWSKLRDDADHCDKRPMLIARQNGMPIVVLLRVEDAERFFDLGDSSYGVLSAIDSCDVAVFHFNDFLAKKYKATRFP